MSKLIFVFIALLASCTTINVTMVHTAGTASDVVDSVQTPTNTTDVKADASIPTSVIP